MSDPQPKAMRAGALIRAVADILDFITIFLAGGLIVAAFTGNLTAHGWSLYGWAGWTHTIVIIVYFWLGRCYLGGTLWTRILRIH